MVLSLVGIFVSLILLITLAYRGHSVIALAPLMSMLAIVLAGQPILASYTQIYMPALAGFIASFFPLFLVGAIFGKLMSVSGYAQDFANWVSQVLGARRAILVTVLATALLTFGGVSAWVIVFTIFPIALRLYERADIPKRLMPPAIALGIFTFATAALPGSPQIHNAIPTRFFGTTAFAAPGLGLIGAAITFTLGYLWLEFRSKKLRARGESFHDLTILERKAASGGDTGADPADPDPHGAPGHGEAGGSSVATATSAPERISTARGLVAAAPVLVVMLVGIVTTYVILPGMDTSYLAEKRFGAVPLSQVLGVWSVISALTVAIVAIFLMRPSQAQEYVAALSDGARNAVQPVFTTASEVGYGAVIASLAAFALIRDGIFGISGNALVTSVLSTSVIALVTGSASGGLTISLNTFGEQLVQMATQQGIPMDLMHRATAIASTGFDSMPHNGAIITLLLVTGLTHRESYKDIAVVTVLVPVTGLIAVMILGMLFGSF